MQFCQFQFTNGSSGFTNDKKAGIFILAFSLVKEFYFC